MGKGMKRDEGKGGGMGRGGPVGWGCTENEAKRVGSVGGCDWNC